MNIQAEKLELIELLLRTESEAVLKKLRYIFESTINDNKLSLRRKELLKKEQSLSFDWEGGLKDLKKQYNGVQLQHHINSLRK